MPGVRVLRKAGIAVIVVLASAVLILQFGAVSKAQQEPLRLALLIGNKKYTNEVGPLNNPHSDVALLEAALKKLNFSVTVIHDANYRVMDSAVKQYVAQLRNAGAGSVSFFYYSGHGVSNSATHFNFLVPIDANLEDPSFWSRLIKTNDIYETLSQEASQATHYVVLDSCRNEMQLSERVQRSLGAKKGFSPVKTEAVPMDTLTQRVLIAYSTSPGQTASDSGDGGGPYAKALANEIIKPGIEAVFLFHNVQVRVQNTIGQQPWMLFPILQPIYMTGHVHGEVTTPPSTDVERYCRLIELNPSVSVVTAVAKAYNNTPIATCAEARLQALQNAEFASP